MSKITVERIKRRGGSLMTYYCVFNMTKEEFSFGTDGDTQFSARQMTTQSRLEYLSQHWKEPKQIEPLKNGEMVYVNLEKDGINKMFVWTMASGGELFSDIIDVSPGKSYSIKTKTGLMSLKLLVSES